MKALWAALFVACAGVASAQQVSTAPGATIRGLDKVSGELVDMTLLAGEAKMVGRLQVSLGQCRYPTDNPAGNAYAWLEIYDAVERQMVFSGWMVASAPALYPLDHPRYDVWVLRCSTE